MTILVHNISDNLNINTVSSKMAAGKYVRAPQYVTDSEEEDLNKQVPLSPEPKEVRESDLESDHMEPMSSESQSSLNSSNASVDDDDGGDSKEAPDLNQDELEHQDEIQANDAGGITSDNEQLVRRTPEGNAALYKRMDQFKQMLDDMAAALNTKQQYYHDPSHDDVEESWISARTAAAHDGPTQNIRWDHIKPFPKGIAASKMWEAWHSYIETFEIAATLGNAFDQTKRAQLLFLSVGEEMQAIIRAAKLRPNLADANCYAKFVRNIDLHLKSMTDTSAELETFSNMQQGKDESVVTFHARLVEKVRLCGYSVADQERFVRAQLIKGMSNRVVAKNARTYGYDTNFIVQSAIRDSIFDNEPGPSCQDRILALEERHARAGSEVLDGGRAGSSRQADIFALERRGSRIVSDRDQRTRQRNFATRDARQEDRSRSGTRTPGRRELCSRCRYLSHRNGLCPAVSRNCNMCGMKGHFAAACRQRRIGNSREER